MGAFGLLSIDLGAVASALGGANPWLLAVALVAYALGQTLSGAMWAGCQSAGGVRGMPLPTALGLHWISRAACELLPASLGEVIRVALVRRHPAGAAAGGWRIAGGLGGYKAIDAAVTGVAVLAIAVAVPLPGPAAGLRWTAIGAVVVVGIVALIWRYGPAHRVGALLPACARRAAARLGEGAGILADGPAARRAALIAVAALVARIVSLGALLAAFDAPAGAAALAFSVIVLAGVIPLVPGGAGTREVILVPALALANGVPTSTAIAFSLSVQALALSTSLVLGAAALAWLSPRLRAHRVEAGPLPRPALAAAPA